MAPLGMGMRGKFLLYHKEIGKYIAGANSLQEANEKAVSYLDNLFEEIVLVKTLNRGVSSICNAAVKDSNPTNLAIFLPYRFEFYIGGHSGI